MAEVSIPPLCQRLGLLGRNIHTTHGLLVSEAIVRRRGAELAGEFEMVSHWRLLP